MAPFGVPVLGLVPMSLRLHVVALTSNTFVLQHLHPVLGTRLPKVVPSAYSFARNSFGSFSDCRRRPSFGARATCVRYCRSAVLIALAAAPDSFLDYCIWRLVACANLHRPYRITF